MQEDRQLLYLLSSIVSFTKRPSTILVSLQPRESLLARTAR
jgi:hypothetical protein